MDIVILTQNNPASSHFLDLPRTSGYVKHFLTIIRSRFGWLGGSTMTHTAPTQPEHHARTASLAGLVMPSREPLERGATVDALHAGLHSILVQWAHGKSSFGWVRSVGGQHVEVRVRDGSDEDASALIFSIVQLPENRTTQEFRVSTQGRGLLGQIKARDTRILAHFRSPREMWTWSDLTHFIEQQAALSLPNSRS
jgi:hypothetical protein